MTSVVFRSLVLDPASDPNAKARTITFSSSGNADPVRIEVLEAAPMTQTTMCVGQDGAALSCRTAAKPPVYERFGRAGGSAWRLTLLGQGMTQPQIDVRISWPARLPQLSGYNFRFEGVKTPAYAGGLRGVTVDFTAPGDGIVTLDSTSVAGVEGFHGLSDMTNPADPARVSVDIWHSGATHHFQHAIDRTTPYRLSLVNQAPDDATRTYLRFALAYP